MKTVVTFPGSGIQIIEVVMNKLGVDVIEVTRAEQVEHVAFDGIILCGGGDINPALYKEKNTLSQYPNSKRDLTELRMVRTALERNLPMLGICRGMQLLAAAFGGSLYQDIYKQKVTTYHPSKHGVDFEGKLADVAPTTMVNSLHHQAVKTLPPSFKMVGQAYDGICEAMWKPGILGVQFHPELLIVDSDTRWVNIFRWFIGGLR